MVAKVYLPEEVCELLRISHDELFRAITSGEIDAFQIVGQWRITEEALMKVMSRHLSRSTTPHSRVQGNGRRNTDPDQVRMAKSWVWERLRKVAPDLGPRPPSKEFMSNEKQGILSVASVDTPMAGAAQYFFGFPRHLLDSKWPTFLVPVIAPRDWPEPKAFVIPCDRYRASIDRWAVDRSDGKKYYIRQEPGRFLLKGKGMKPVDIAEYLNAFHLLGKVDR
jgi:excisionase family DNA binding protein